MADTKISDLTAAGSVDGSELVPIVQSATTKSATLSQVAGLAGGGGTSSYVTGSDFSTSSTSLVDVTGLTFAAAANTLYEIDVLLRISADNSNGMRVGVGYTTAGSDATILVWGGVGANISNAAAELETANGLQSQVLATDATVKKAVYMKGWLKTGVNTGNFTVKCLKVTSGNATVYIGSRLTVI